MPGPWPAWARNTASAAVGLASGAVIVSLFIADVRNTAVRADRGVDDHEPRIRKLEEQAADVRAMRRQIDDMQADIKTLLSRTPPR